MKNVNKFISNKRILLRYVLYVILYVFLRSYNNVYIIEAKLDTSSHNRLTKSKFIESSSIYNKVLKVEIPLFKN